MKKSILILTCLSIGIIACSQNVYMEKEAIKNVVQTAYVEGLQNEGDADKIDQGFHEHFHLLGISEKDEMWHLNITEWKKKQVQKRKSGELPFANENKVSVKFASIDVTGTAAMVKLEYFVGDKLTYIDYISLYKFESGWKMVNKIFYKVKVM